MVRQYLSQCLARGKNTRNSSESCVPLSISAFSEDSKSDMDTVSKMLVCFVCYKEISPDYYLPFTNTSYCVV